MFLYVSERKGEEITACNTAMCRSVCMYKAGRYQLYPIKTSGMGGKGEMKDKSHRYSKKKRYIITLRASQR